jgi:hypothetical protein
MSLREITDYLTLVENDAPLIQLLDHSEVMRRDHNRHTSGIRLKEEIKHSPTHLMVEVSRRLVCQD